MSTCSNCGKELDEPRDISTEQRKPCPSCGSIERVIKQLLKGESTSHGMLKGKKLDLTGEKRKGKKKKALSEFMVGSELCVDMNKWVRKERYIDRENNWYKEIVVDPATNQLIRDLEEPLSEHWNRGSAKHTVNKE